MTEAELQHRREVIEKIVTYPANGYTKKFLDGPHPKTGRKYSNAELETYLEELEQAPTNSVEEQILKAQAEIYAERTLHQLRMQPQRQAQAAKQLAHDQQTFAAAAKTLRSFGVTEANLNLTRQALGAGFSLFAIQQALSSNALQLSPPSQAEWDTWSAEAIEHHNHQLLNATDSDLRKIVKQESTDARVQQVQSENDRQLESLRTKDAPFNYPPLPSDFTKDSLLQIVKQDTKKYRFIIQKFGNFNVTARLQGRG